MAKYDIEDLAIDHPALLTGNFQARATAMANKPIDRKARRLEEIKSAYILEAQASLARGLDWAAMALFSQ